ncbi:DEAD/DEAH box helicase [Corynebacterium lizhenjunii]|uniref:DEAD/DEAH box helicase n=1 Tax=Corynebacterium lizhenjunii TaxID=2709394 RepID=A0A7T0PA39_9CORY|nr:DEAD/DEAH box helicase [Corynebacterium lizhenjunii]QPK78586.1 DEAD/DEAH box helicase [Corynebacterium lizhenjunii]
MTDDARIHYLEQRISALEEHVAQLLATLNQQSLSSAPPPADPESLPQQSELSPTEKIALFMEYFVGRTDVFARASTTKKSWYPATVSYNDRTLIPLTQRDIEQHLRRDNNAHVGLYPMLPDDTCRLLACDFDDADFAHAAVRYAKTCREHGLSPLIEVSRSGSGAHVWLFFTEPVPARLARSVGLSLLTKASPTAVFTSFDRFFPSQDTLPTKSKSFGNLIALPLAGHHRANNTTVFVNDAFEPFADQFAALSNATKATPSQLKQVYAQLQPDPETDLPVAPTTAQLKALRKSGTVKVTHDSHVHIDLSGIDSTTATALRHLGAIPNPQFYIKQAQRFSTFGTPRLIVRFTEKDNQLTLDRGTLDSVLSILTTAGYTVTRRGHTPKPRKVDMAFVGELYPQQKKAIKDVTAHKTGMLIAPPGAGKTVMACYIIAQRCVPTAIIVPNAELLNQWRRSFEEFLPGTPVGQYSGKKKKLSGVVDLITAQSISRVDSRTDFLADYGHIIVDECHRVGAAGLTHTLAGLNVRFFLGLTATPFRSDGLDKLLPMICGPIRHTMELNRPGPKHYHVHETSFAYDAPYLFWPDLDTALAADAARNQLIASVTVAVAGADHNVVVLVKRREHLAHLQKFIEKSEPKVPIFKLHGGLSAKERSATLDKLTASSSFILLAMSQIAGEGLDLPSLDTLVLAAPVAFHGNIIQQVGRITRDATGECSSAATVHDFLDKDVPALAAAFRKRQSTLKKEGFSPAIFHAVDQLPN